MKIAIAQINCHIGNFEGNVTKMLERIAEAKAEGADIICFPELAVCGYPPRDFLEFDNFIKKSEEAIRQLAAAAAGIAIAVGAPRRNPVIEGKDLYNSAFFLADGEIKYIYDKVLLPTYDIFDEYRYFEPGSAFGIVKYKGYKIAMTICEDIWNIGNENPLYTVCPMDEMARHQPDFMLNLSASPFAYDHPEERREIVALNAKKYATPVFYCNHVGAQTELIFDGGSVIMSPNGELYEELPYFKEEMKYYDLEPVKKGRQYQASVTSKIERIHDALVIGIRDYFRKSGLKTAILGLSGGIDSAVVAVLTQRALGKENVRVLLMPSQFSTDHSIDDARELAENLGIQYDIIEIEPIYQTYEKALHPYFKDLPFNIAEENIQARARGMLLMAFSNKFGNILLNTSNKSEMAVGYGTLYGDLAGGISVIGDVYKMEVYELSRYMNKDGEVIPENIITKPPSAELRHDQKDSDSLPDYEVLDEILYLYINRQLGPKEIIAQGFDEALVNRILKMVNRNEFKRHQTAPVLRVSAKAFGMGRRMPIVGKYLT